MATDRSRGIPGSPHSSLDSEEADPATGEVEAANEAGIELSPEKLSPAALRGLVEEFVSREGTDYGHADRSLEGKVADVLRQLESGEARIVFDLERESASIVSARALRESRARRRRGSDATS